MSDPFKHVVLPLAAPAALMELYFTPKMVFGCVNRGYLALAEVLIATIVAIVTTMIALAEKKRGNAKAGWWMITTLILLSPIVLLRGPLG